MILEKTYSTKMFLSQLLLVHGCLLFHFSNFLLFGTVNFCLSFVANIDYLFCESWSFTCSLSFILSREVVPSFSDSIYVFHFYIRTASRVFLSYITVGPLREYNFRLMRSEGCSSLLHHSLSCTRSRNNSCALKYRMLNEIRRLYLKLDISWDNHQKNCFRDHLRNALI